MAGYICPQCHARLDPGEKCKCEPVGNYYEKSRAEQTVSIVIRDGKAFAVTR